MFQFVADHRIRSSMTRGYALTAHSRNRATALESATFSICGQIFAQWQCSIRICRATS